MQPKDGFSKGDTVKLASHMSGMKGATANIDNVKRLLFTWLITTKDNGKIIKIING